jgi:two-component system, sensor histidine kinase PdtaS
MQSKLFLAVTILLTAFCSIEQSRAQSKADSVMNAVSELVDTAKVQKLNNMAVELFNSDLQASSQMAEKALEISLKAKYKKGEAAALNVLGSVWMRRGEFAKALHMCRQAESIYTTSRDKAGIAEVCNTIGMVYNQEGQYPLALENFSKALQLRQELGQKEFVPLLIENIGIVHFRQGDYQLALQYFKDCFQTYQDLGNERSASKILVNIGATYNKLNMPKEALQAHEQSLAYFEKTNSVAGMGVAYNNIGSVFFNLKDYQKAIANYTRSLELKRRMNDKRGIAVSLKNIAEAYMMLNNLPRAREIIDQSLKIAEEIGSREQTRDAYEMLSKIYEATRDFEKALMFERKMSQARDSMFSADKTAQISRMRAIYETDKAEQEAKLTRLQAEYEIGQKDLQRNFFIALAVLFMVAALLTLYSYRQKQKSNRLLSDTNAVIEKSLRERETLLKEIHHRVKNNLQIISSLLSLQSKSLHDTDAQDAISESRNRVKSMSLIHEQLYQDDTISGVDMNDYIHRLTNSLVASYGVDTDRVEIKINADNILLDVDSAIPLGLIMNELVSNSMKYAFPKLRQGSILISLEETMSGLRLVIQDDGIGFDSGARDSYSFGLNLVNSLMRKLKAEMNIVSGPGTSVELIIRDFKKVTFVQATGLT